MVMADKRSVHVGGTLNLNARDRGSRSKTNGECLWPSPSNTDCPLGARIRPTFRMEPKSPRAHRDDDTPTAHAYLPARRKRSPQMGPPNFTGRATEQAARLGARHRPRPRPRPREGGLPPATLRTMSPACQCQCRGGAAFVRACAGFLQRRCLQKSFIVARDGPSFHANRTRLDDTIIPATVQYSNTGAGGEETKKNKIE